jgi:hypothetical protein
MTNKVLIALAIAAVLGVLNTFAFAANPSVAFYWDAVTKDANGVALAGGVTYNVYQATGSTLVPVLVQSGITGTSASITAGLTPGTTQCFDVTAKSLVTALEGSPSPEMCIDIPTATAPPTPAKPAAPTNPKVTLVQH